jgi:hypothetical protein
MPSAGNGGGQTFLISGILGVNFGEICEKTSCMRGWFFMVFRTFMMLGETCEFSKMVGKRRLGGCAPDNSHLDNIFAIFVDRLQDITPLGLDLSLNWLVHVKTNLL